MSVWKARLGRWPAARSPRRSTSTSPSAGGVVGGRAEIGAAIPEQRVRPGHLRLPAGGHDGLDSALGTDDNAPYRVFHDVTGIAKGTLLEYRAVAKDISGNVSATSTYGIVGDPRAGGGGSRPVGPVTQPDNVSVPGDAQLRDGLRRATGSPTAPRRS